MLPLASLRIANKIAIKSTMANGVRCCLDEGRAIFLFFLTVDRCGRSCCVCDELIVLQIIDWKGILGGAVKNYGCVESVACCMETCFAEL